MFASRLGRNLRHSGSYLWISFCIAMFLVCCPCIQAQPQLSSAPPPGVLSGQVLNGVNGQPVPRALIRFNERAILADHEGKFEFDRVTETSGNLQVTKPGFAMSSDPSDSPNLFFQLDQLNGPIEVRLYPEGLLIGTISAPDGEPLSHINVLARRSVYDESGHHWFPVGFAQTDTHGQFRLPVPPGEYKLQTRYVSRDPELSAAVLPLTVPADGTPNAAQTIHLHSGEEQRFDLHPNLRRTFAVDLTIEANADHNNPTITARSSDGAILTVSPLPTRIPGQLRVDLPTGSYTLTGRINAPDYAEIAETNVTIADHDLSGVVLHFTPIPAIPVELVIDTSSTSDNSPPILAQFGLTLQSADSDGEIGYPGVQLISRRDSPSILNAPPGSYRLQARNANQWYIKSASYGASDLLRQNLIVAAGSGSVPIRLLVSNQTGSLQGTIKLGGRPSYAWLYLINGGSSATPVLTLRSNSDGTFTSPHLPPGTYQAIAFKHRHSADFTDPAAIATFATRVQSITIAAGIKSTLNLDAVPQSELLP